MPGISLIVDTILSSFDASVNNGNTLLIAFLWTKTPPELDVILFLHNGACKVQALIIAQKGEIITVDHASEPSFFVKEYAWRGFPWDNLMLSNKMHTYLPNDLKRPSYHTWIR